jgi:hypothetical protein
MQMAMVGQPVATRSEVIADGVGDKYATLKGQ